jgi:hypothetical protein
LHIEVSYSSEYFFKKSAESFLLQHARFMATSDGMADVIQLSMLAPKRMQ